MSQQQVNIADLDLSSLQQVKTQLEEVYSSQNDRETAIFNIFNRN